jgi:hypothetical protein
VLLLGILKYYTLQMEGIAIYQAPIASKLVLFSPIRAGLFYLPVFVEIVQSDFSQPV